MLLILSAPPEPLLQYPCARAQQSERKPEPLQPLHTEPINNMQTECIAQGEVRKSPLFWRFSGGGWFSQELLFFWNSTRKSLNWTKSPILRKTACKSACLCEAPSLHTVESVFLGALFAGRVGNNLDTEIQALKIGLQIWVPEAQDLSATIYPWSALTRVHQNRASPFAGNFSLQARVLPGILQWESILPVLSAERKSLFASDFWPHPTDLWGHQTFGHSTGSNLERKPRTNRAQIEQRDRFEQKSSGYRAEIERPNLTNFPALKIRSNIERRKLNQKDHG